MWLRTDVTHLAQQAIPILTFHSISHGEGPTNIPPDVFEMQINSIADLGVDVIGLDDVEAWINGTREIDRPSIAITFDDAFDDFARNAFPVLDMYGFRACVFAPTSLIDGDEEWAPPSAIKRKLMGWAMIEDLSRQGVDFGSHSCSHCDLTALSDGNLESELTESQKVLEDRLSRPIRHFAPPYGYSDERVRKAIAQSYDLSVGVRLNKAHKSSPKFDLPRIEMHYYRNETQWRSFLTGKGRVYFNARRLLRETRAALEGVLG